MKKNSLMNSTRNNIRTQQQKAQFIFVKNITRYHETQDTKKTQ